MRVETTSRELYSFDELSEEAKEKAIEEHRESMASFGDPWISENRDTLNAFERIFPIKVKDWEYGYHNYINFEFTGDEAIENLHGIRLSAYLWNNYKNQLFKGKYYNVTSNKIVKHNRVKSTVYKNGNVFNAYYSAITLEHSCVLTGYALDEDILEDIYKYIDRPGSRNFKELLYDCLQAWVYACNENFEYQNSDEAIQETIEANEYEFTKDGKLA